MRKLILLAVLMVLGFAIIAPGQEPAQAAFENGRVEIGPWVGGGFGLGQRTDWHFFNAGLRLGKVLTEEIGTGPLRGHFEFNADIIPVYMVYQPEAVAAPVAADPSKVIYYYTGRRQRVYGYSFNPVVLTWDFTRGRKIVPFFSAEGGFLVTRKDVPFPDTDHVNFTPGGAFGAHFFIKQKQAITISGHVTHISNASLGDHNPGVNSSIQFRVGYTWFK